MSVFQEIIKLKEEYKKELEQAKWRVDKESINDYQERLNFINMLLRVKEEKWHLTDKARKELDLILSKGISAAATELGKKPTTVSKLLYRRSEEFRKLIGVTTLDLLRKGNTKGALLQFKRSWGIIKLSDLFMPDLWSRLDQQKLKDDIKVELLDCKEELKLLKLYSMATFNEQLGNVDMNKIYGLLIFLESTNIAYHTERSLFLQYLSGELSYNDFIQELKK